jgi:hypothetical protein
MRLRRVPTSWSDPRDAAGRAWAVQCFDAWRDAAYDVDAASRRWETALAGERAEAARGSSPRSTATRRPPWCTSARGRRAAGRCAPPRSGADRPSMNLEGLDSGRLRAGTSVGGQRRDRGASTLRRRHRSCRWRPSSSCALPGRWRCWPTTSRSTAREITSGTSPSTGGPGTGSDRCRRGTRRGRAGRSARVHY